MIRFYQSQYPEENYVIRALFDGCPEPKVLTDFRGYQSSEVAVVMGVFKKGVPASFMRGEVIARQKRRGLDCLILETGYINRGDGPENHYALGWNGLNGRADFCNKESPDDRAGIATLKPWREGGDHILLCAQVPWDASVDFTDHYKWIEMAASMIRNETSRPIVFRPHPKAPAFKTPIGCRRSDGGPIESDLKNAHCLVTFNSNTGVDAIIAGIPVVSFDVGSMVYSVSGHEWSEIENPPMPERQQWLNDICYAQWTPDEMRNGTAWRHVLKKFATT